ncbi:hypothetical protein SELMODRAFT_419156 [Selaginella moellendorffii]|uniref:Uncharacterized protein n=1 Tax=Selaginella moellendorffii TaxID=88036 RepID=D8S814_SELML|nr:hypothetical protein SELMODRAFT_419156 [Selaginella moellendorffii]
MESLLKIAGHNESLSIQFCNDFCEPGFEAKDSLKTKFLGSIGFTVSCEGGSPGACLDFLTNVGVPRAANYRQYQARNRSRLEIAYDKWLYEDEKFRLKSVANTGVDIGNLVDESAILAFASWLTHRGPAVTAVKCRDWGRDSLDNNYVYVGDYEQEFKHCLLVVGFKWKERLWTLLNSHDPLGISVEGIEAFPQHIDSVIQTIPNGPQRVAAVIQDGSTRNFETVIGTFRHSQFVYDGDVDCWVYSSSIMSSIFEESQAFGNYIMEDTNGRGEGCWY